MTAGQEGSHSARVPPIASDRELIVRYQEHGDEAAREELVARYLPLARRLAARYRHTNEESDDLVQVASIALVKAIDRFDTARSSGFSSYAVPTILGELKRHFRDHGWAVHVPRELQERATKIGGTIDELGKKLGRAPSVTELAEALGLDPEHTLEAMQAADAYDALSFDAPSVADEDRTALLDTLGQDDPAYEVVEYGAAIQEALSEMAERDRLVLHLRFVEDLTQSEIAERIGVSQMHVSRLLRRAVASLQRAASTSGA
jgi:RNA polymerase sigma-B factor